MCLWYSKKTLLNSWIFIPLLTSNNFYSFGSYIEVCDSLCVCVCVCGLRKEFKFGMLKLEKNFLKLFLIKHVQDVVLFPLDLWSLGWLICILLIVKYSVYICLQSVKKQYHVTRYGRQNSDTPKDFHILFRRNCKYSIWYGSRKLIW